ncbi:hypothetical protein GO013_10475 [Pseudodesulfovibrio sp. JC047]|uniref:DUF1573 domain-containing protein n=1 Tax=Pseudodesulfovibrio sp. JC047 TaxID=2683199 RepID=UPI0013D09A6D|nr:DUF1573 domain-containing protein [Pseudodesulfovibrio sp. JC047]NDV19845.1 hypothetical protein [Pseudodesulfovibrio sp. JC047]
MLRKMQWMVLALGMLCASSAMAAQPVSISDMKVDFGTMTEGPVASKTVTLTNISKEVVTIKNVSTS